MKIGECCNREVVVAEKHMQILDTAKLMTNYHVGDLVVVEKRNGVARAMSNMNQLVKGAVRRASRPRRG